MAGLPASPLEQLKVTELRDELKKRGLSLKGVKKELFERLEDALKKEGQEGLSLGFAQEEEHPDESRVESHDAILPQGDASPDTSLPMNEESKTHSLSAVSQPDGAPGLIEPFEDSKQGNLVDAANEETNNNVLFVDNAGLRNGNGLLLPKTMGSVKDASVLVSSSGGANDTESNLGHADESGNCETLPGVSCDDGFVVSEPVGRENAESSNVNIVGISMVYGGKCSATDMAALDDVDNCNIASMAVVDNLANMNDATPGKQEDEPSIKSNSTDVVGLHVTEDQSSKSDFLIENAHVAHELSMHSLSQTSVSGGSAIQSKDEAVTLKLENSTSLEHAETFNVDEADRTKSGEKHNDDRMDVHGTGSEHLLPSREGQTDKDDKISPEELQVKKQTFNYGAESAARVTHESRRATMQVDGEKYKPQINTTSKRKDDVMHLKQQEPAKRMRRWNSGKQVGVDSPKPLTTDTVKEIMLPEVMDGFSDVARKLTPRTVATSRPLPPLMVESESNGNKRTVPPSTRASSNSLKIQRFVRPFTLKAVKDLLAEFGECVDFWMDQIKTHCYVTYSSVNEAVAARNALYSKQWPPVFGNFLTVDFVDAKEVKIKSEGSLEKAQAPTSASTQATTSTSSFRTVNPPPPRVAPSTSFHVSSSTLPPPPPPLRERQVLLLPKQEPEPLAPTLEDLFFKTKAKPHIYYSPLTDEQVAEKLAKKKQMVR